MFVTLCQYLYSYYRHHRYIELVKNTSRYRNAQKSQKMSLNNSPSSSELTTNKKRKKLNSGESPPEEDVELDVEIKGAEIIHWKNLIIFQLLFLPWTVTRYSFYIGRWLIWYQILRRPQPDREEEARKEAGMTIEEWERYKASYQKRYDNFRTSSKGKRYRRWMKNR